MRNLGNGSVRLAGALVALVGGAILVVGYGPLEKAEATVLPPTALTRAAACAFDVLTDLKQGGSAWRALHTGRGFSDGVVAGMPADDVKTAMRLGRRYARARASAERTAGRGHAGLARALKRWDGTSPAGFYRPAEFAGLTRSMWYAERANEAAWETMGFLMDHGTPPDELAALAAAHRDSGTHRSEGDRACLALIDDLVERCDTLIATLHRDAHVQALGRRLGPAHDAYEKALAADGGRPRAMLLARAYRMFVATARRGNAFEAVEHRALRRLVVPVDDGSIVNDTGEPILVYDIHAALTVRVMRKEQTTHASASDWDPGAFALAVPDGAALDGFDYLVFDREEITDGSLGFVRLTYETSIGDVHALYRLR